MTYFLGVKGTWPGHSLIRQLCMHDIAIAIASILNWM